MIEGFGELQLAWAELLMRGFIEAGGREVVISPGSRSTPFVLAATRNPKLRCFDAMDERSAGFFALGMAKVTDRPPMLICTSGTAGAHYLPSIIEAALSYTPLLVLTADRPFELQGCRAPQTIDQVKLFGDHVRSYVELGLADASQDAQRWLHSAIHRAMLVSHSPVPGPVHINARARKPLEPTTPFDSVTSEGQKPERSGPRTFSPRLVPDDAGVDALARAILNARRGLIVCGPQPISAVQCRSGLHGLASATRFPVLAEAASQFRFAPPVRSPNELNEPTFCDAFDPIVASPSFEGFGSPDLIIQIGAPPTSSAWEKFLFRNPGIERWVLAAHGWNDPQSSARGFLFGGVEETLRATSARVQKLAKGSVRESGEWEMKWVRAEIAARRAIDAVLSESGPQLSEGAVAQAVVASLPQGSVLALGNSLPIRQVDTFCAGSSADCLVWSQRGGNGIDGLVSGSAGVATLGYPTTLLVGDVAFLHDVGGLALATKLNDPLVIVVVQNQGGRMFEQLPVAQLEGLSSAMHHWLTPHEISFEHAAKLYQHAYQRVSTKDALQQALAQAHRQSGCTIIEAVVPPHGAAELQRRAQARVNQGLEAAARGPVGAGERSS